MKSDNRSIAIRVVVILLLGALVALAGSQGGATVGGVPVFALAVALAFAIQIAVFIPSFMAQTEHFFDLTGSLTYLSITALILLVTPGVDARGWLLGAMVMVWALRLGTFRFTRVRRSGSDDRFDEIKPNLGRFLSVWLIQGLWVTMTAAAAWIAMTSAQRVALDWLAWVGVALWALGFGIEVVADAQKSAFKADPANKGRFISTGLWSKSRHPNYFGEILLWVGVALVALPALSGWQYVGLLSPVFVALLLIKASGIPLLEAKADKLWGGQADYEAYKASTPVLIPRP